MSVVIRPLREADLPAAVKIYRDSFCSFLNIPERMLGDENHVGTRFYGYPEGSLCAEMDGQLVGSNFACRWGSVAVLGPTTVRPTGWTGAAGKLMMDAGLALALRWGTTHQVGFTFAQSPKHVDFFQRLGFWPRFLTAIMAFSVRKNRPPVPGVRLCSGLSEGEREEELKDCARLTDALYPGLDLSQEIRTIHQRGYGDTLTIRDGSTLLGFAACHVGPGSEAGSNTCYIKFGAVQPGQGADQRFDQLLDACEALAASRGMNKLTAGVNTARHGAYRKLIGRGFLTLQQGIALHRNDDPGYCRPDVFALDAWR